MCSRGAHTSDRNGAKDAASRVTLEENDRLRCEVEQARRREQLGNDDDDEHREASRRRARTKRVRTAVEREAARLPADLIDIQ